LSDLYIRLFHELCDTSPNAGYAFMWKKLMEKNTYSKSYGEICINCHEGPLQSIPVVGASG